MGTAIEWLVEELKSRSIDLNKWNGDLVEQAKEMEKQQIIEAHGDEQSHLQDDGSWITVTAEQYYNETFKSE